MVSALLEDASGRAEGQLYRLGNEDLALLFRPSDNGAGVAGAMDTLLQGLAPNPAYLRSLWTLPDEAMPALHYVRLRAAEPKRAVQPVAASAAQHVVASAAQHVVAAAAQPVAAAAAQHVVAAAAQPVAAAAAQAAAAARAGSAAAMAKLAHAAPLESLFFRQTAVTLRPGHKQRIAPTFREIAIAYPLLDGRITAAKQTEADPFLAGHFAAQLDRRLLTALRADLAQGPLSGGPAGTALHVNLTLSAVLSQEFALFMAASEPAVAAGLRFAVEVPFVEVFADPKGFLLARERLQLASMSLVLDGVEPQALSILRPAELGPHLVKLAWSPALAGAGPELLQAMQRLGTKRIVIEQADTEAAIVWGLGQGIQLFQGRYIDMMLAADRLRTCPSAASCTMRECGERAAAIKPAGRSGCGNLDLLDAGMAPALTEAQ